MNSWGWNTEKMRNKLLKEKSTLYEMIKNPVEKYQRETALIKYFFISSMAGGGIDKDFVKVLQSLNLQTLTDSELSTLLIMCNYGVSSGMLKVDQIEFITKELPVLLNHPKPEIRGIANAISMLLSSNQVSGVLSLLYQNMHPLQKAFFIAYMPYKTLENKKVTETLIDYLSNASLQEKTIIIARFRYVIGHMGKKWELASKCIDTYFQIMQSSAPWWVKCDIIIQIPILARYDRQKAISILEWASIYDENEKVRNYAKQKLRKIR
jgi:hypothetical protein